MSGGSNCLITKHNTISGNISVQRYAHSKYFFYPLNNSKVKVKSTCGVLNCVNKNHLIAEYKPTKKDIEYINTYIKVDGIEIMSHRLEIPIHILTEFIKTSSSISR